VAILVLGAVGAFVLATSKPPVETETPVTPAPLVRVMEVSPRTVELTVESQGTVEPRTVTQLAAQVAGTIQWVSPSFADGGQFAAGETLVRIDPRDYQLAAEQAEAQVAQARTLLERERAEAAVAAEEWAELGDGGPAPPLVLREPQLAEARATLSAAEARVTQARIQLQRTTVAAPYAGRVRQRQADVGQAVAAGTPLGTVYATDFVEIPLPVPVAELEFLEVTYDGDIPDGPTVELSAPFAGRLRTWRGRIVRTGGDISRDSRMVDLVARVDQPFGAAARAAGAPLTPGLFVEARIEGSNLQGAVIVPRSVLRDTGGWKDGEPARVPVVEAGRLRFRAVTIARLSGDEAVVTSGLRPGDLVVVSPLEAPVDGMAVRTDRADAEGAPERPVPEGDL
jgi:RND family efflux transporter MFP subunit